MDSIRGFFRSGLWLCFLLCVLSVASHSNAATRKHVTMPTAQSVATSPGAGVPVKSGSTLSIPGAAQGEYIPFQPGDRKVPLKVIPTIDYSIPRTIEATKGFLKNNAASIVVGGVIAGMVAGLDWVMGEGSELQKIDNSPVDYIPTGSDSYWSIFANVKKPSASSACQHFADDFARNTYGSSITSVSVTNVRPGIDATCSIKYSQGSSTGTLVPVAHFHAGSCPAGLIPSSDFTSCINPAPVPVTESDFSLIDAYANAQNSQWHRNLLNEACNGSSRCYDQLKERSQLNGPTTVQGPTTTTSGTYTKPDGTVGTKAASTTTNYKVTYGPTYFDFSKTQTTIWNEDGQQVGEETVTENDDIEAEEPAEKPQEEQVASPCEGSSCDGPAYEDLYSPSELTKEDHLDSYSDRVSSIPIISAVGSLFDVSISAGACPTWSYNSTLDLGIASMPIDLNFDYHCLPWFVSLGPWIQTIFLLGCTLGAIRIGIL